MDQYVIQDIFNKLNHDDRIKMNNVITIYGNLFECVYELKAKGYFTDADLLQYTNLTILNCNYCENISDKSIRELKGLTTLNCWECQKISDESIRELKGLKELECGCYKNISDNSIIELKNLTTLICWNCENI